jgi:GMP synthase-like glutamine amidotransferase
VVRAEMLHARNIVQLTVEFCMGGCEDRTWAREAEEFPLLKAVVRERLKQRAGKMLGRCYGDLWIVEIIGGAVITCSSESCV